MHTYLRAKKPKYTLNFRICFGREKQKRAEIHMCHLHTIQTLRKTALFVFLLALLSFIEAETQTHTHTHTHIAHTDTYKIKGGVCI